MNDERPIEKLLRRYAKKRVADAGPPPDLHPATRRLLQGEVSRQFRKSNAVAGEDVSFGKILRGWMPWLGWATVMVAVVGIGALMIFGGRGTQEAFVPTKSQPVKFELAKNEEPDAAGSKMSVAEAQKELAVRNQPATPSPSATIAAPAAPSPQPPAAVLADSSAVREEAVRIASAEKKSPAARSFSASKPGATTTRENFKTESLALTSGDKPGFAGGPATAQKLVASDLATRRTDAPPLVTTTADALYSKAPTLARGGGLERDRAQNVAQNYSNAAAAPRYANAAKSAPVLKNFQVEQSGNQLRVIDSDGSTYSGEIAGLENFPSAGGGGGRAPELKKKTLVPIGAAAPTLAPGKLPATAQEQGQNYFYRVAGTNRTLNQQVVFTWNFVAATNDGAMRQVQGVTGALNKDKVGAELPAQLPNSPINGRARLGAGKEIEINATPVK